MKTKLILLAVMFSFAAFAGCDKNNKATLKTICFNIRLDTEDDGDNAWTFRKEAVVEMLKVEKPQLFGMQEAYKHQLDYITGNLDGYASIGVGRDDGKEEGEYSPIVYNTKELKVVKSGYFWLSETPDEPSMGWDAACKRIATWGVFEDLRNQKQFICINTHFDHVGKLARENSGKQMLDSIKTLAVGLPAIIMGDFNAPIDDISLRPLVQNAKSVRNWNPDFEKQPAYSFIGFSSNTQKVLIDHIFVQNFVPVDYRIIQETYGIKQLSDHLPVMSILSY